MSKTNWKPLRILFIGEEPSSKNKSPDVPFVGTPSYKRLLRWIGELDLDINSINTENSGNIEYESFQHCHVVIFLGKSAEKKSKLATRENMQTKIITIDHPSPRNRNFNKPGYEAKMLKDLKRWLYE